MKVLFIGGTGNISSACLELALERGYDVSTLNRGTRSAAADQRVTRFVGDRNDLSVLNRAAEGGPYDVVADFVGYTPGQIEKDIAAFSGRIGQYLYISSASAYQKPPNHYVISESTPLRNPYWEYSRNKIACEERLIEAYRDSAFPSTIVRPTYTYGPTWIPCSVGGHGYSVVHRIRKGLPIISHGDGQSLWVMTYNTDFALGFVGVFGVQQAIGEAVHITSDEVLTWDQIYRTIARAAGCQANIVHIPCDLIAALYPRVGASLLGDKAYSVVFDNSKIKRVVPDYKARVSFAEGIARSMAWHDADPGARHVVDEEVNRMMDRLIGTYRRALGCA